MVETTVLDIKLSNRFEECLRWAYEFFILVLAGMIANKQR